MPSGRVIASVVALGLVCTALAFVLFFELIKEIGPTRVTIITYVNPAVALVLGVVFLHESVGVASIVGFVLCSPARCLRRRDRNAKRGLVEVAVSPSPDRAEPV